jgi:hypothetical protein
MQITLKPFSLKLRKNKDVTLNPKLDNELKIIVGSSNFAELVGHEILYQLSTSDEPRYTYWAKIIELSPNNRYIKLIDCDEHNNDGTYYRELSQVNIVDILD